MADSNNGRTGTLRPEDSGPARPSRGNLPPKLVAATEAAQGVLAGWFLAAGRSSSASCSWPLWR